MTRQEKINDLKTLSNVNGKLEVINKIIEISNLEGEKYTDGQILDMILDYCEEEKNKIEQL
jgi:hypothetical protein